MKQSLYKTKALAIAILASVVFSNEALAGTDSRNIAILDLCLALPNDAYSHTAPSTSLMLATNDLQMEPAAAPQVGETGVAQWHEPWLTGNKAHEYMGLGSLILAGLTVATAPNSEAANGTKNDSTHRALANGALALGLGAVTTGFIYHYDDIHWDNGITDPDNLHMILGLLGTAGYAIAIANGGKGGHSTAGIIGAASMVGAIKLEW